MRWLISLQMKQQMNAAWGDDSPCCMSRHFDFDLSNDYTQPFKDKFWFQHTIQVQTAEGPAEPKACIRDLDDSLKNAFDEAMRTVIQAFTKGQCSSHYLIADAGKIEGLKDIGVHSKRVPAFVLPDRCLQARGLDPTVERGFLQRGAADTRSKMRPDMMTVKMTTAEQQQYLRHDDNSGCRRTPLTPLMPNGNPRSIKSLKEDIALIQDMRKSCKKREHNI